MKKLVSVLVLALLLTCTGCNYVGYDIVDTNYHFDKAIIRMPDNSTIEVEIKKWADSENGEQITITATDGTRYLVHSANVVLIEEN